MAHTNSFSSMLRLASQHRFLSGLVLVSLVLLSYVVFLGLAGLTLFMGLMIYRSGPTVRSRLWHQGFVLLAVLLGFNAVWASFHGEALLQLANFLPFFVLFVAFCVFLTETKSPVVSLERWATGLLWATVPINLLAGVEYWLRSPAMMAKLSHRDRWQDFYQLSYGHRAYVVFHHPNVMACFLIMVFGLALGLVFHRLNHTHPGQPPISWGEWCGIVGAMALVLAGIFFTGSRNGILIVAIQVICFGVIARRHKIVAIAGLGSIIALVLAVGLMGIGGRTLSLGIFTHDPRVFVWQFAWDYIQQRPITGWGLGSYKLMYVPGSIPDYVNINHAHNLWITLATEAGLPTTLVFTGVIGRLCYRGVKGIIRPANAIAGNGIFIGYSLAFLGICLFCLFDVPIFDARINIMGWLSLAGLYTAAQQPDLAHAINKRAG